MLAAKTAIASPLETALPTTLRRIVLIGFMGAGKTTVGQLLAESLGWKFLDLDAHVESRSGVSVSELFALHGETHFRRLESTALANALSHTHTILALGGGTAEQLTNRLLLEQTPGTLVLFLDAPFETLFDRCVLQSIESPSHIRPILASPDDARVRFAQRQPHFRRLARHILPVGDLTPAETNRAILQIIAKP